MLQNGDVAKSQRRSNEKESLKLIEMKKKRIYTLFILSITRKK